MTKAKKRVSSRKPKKLFDKYELYHRAVQSPDVDVKFLRGVYKELRGVDPKIFREDFCGTFALSCEWVKMGPKFSASGVDLDPEPLEYGRKHYLPKLSASAQSRLQVLEGNVLKKVPSADVVAAMNFSYYIFKTRELMKEYFRNVYQSLRPNGVFIADLFGGSLCQDAVEEKEPKGGFTYYWDQESFDPVTNRAEFHIHFKVKGGQKQERVFSYDWRMWTIPEIRELMTEVGFKKTHVYWEGTTRNGEGDGKFTRTEKGEACQSWIAYVAGEK